MILTWLKIAYVAAGSVLTQMSHLLIKSGLCGSILIWKKDINDLYWFVPLNNENMNFLLNHFQLVLSVFSFLAGGVFSSFPPFFCFSFFSFFSVFSLFFILFLQICVCQSSNWNLQNLKKFTKEKINKWIPLPDKKTYLKRVVLIWSDPRLSKFTTIETFVWSWMLKIL